MTPESPVAHGVEEQKDTIVCLYCLKPIFLVVQKDLWLHSTGSHWCGEHKQLPATPRTLQSPVGELPPKYRFMARLCNTDDSEKVSSGLYECVFASEYDALTAQLAAAQAELLDIKQFAPRWREQSVGSTHWESCWQDHRGCAITKILLLESKLTTQREDTIQECAAIVNGFGNIIQYVPQRSRTSIANRRASSNDFRDAILALLPTDSAAPKGDGE